MRIHRLVINNFRSIRTAEIDIRDAVALVGQNSAGKTSILRALNAFFNFEEEQSSFESGQHAFQSSSFAVIEVTMGDVPAGLDLPRADAEGNIRARLRLRKTPQWTIYSSGEWKSVEEDFHRKLSAHVSYVFVPLRRDHEVAGWGPGSLMSRVVEAAVTANRQRDRITPQINSLSARVQKQSLDPLLSELRRTTPLKGDFGYALRHTVAPDYSLLLRNLALQVREGNRVVDLEDSGSGTQSMAVFSLYSYLAKIERSTYILGFEEPEQNLHPQAQAQLLRHLRKTGLQVVFTTHSATMIDALEHEEVVLCRRVESSTRAVETEVAQLPLDFFTVNGLDRDAYYTFHKRRNSEFFFSDHVLVTESPIDSLVIQTILEQSGKSMSDNNIAVMPLDGVTNIPNMFHLLRELGIASTYVVDKDYFLPYLNDNLDNSRDSRGYAIYRRELKPDSLAATLFPDVGDRGRLLDALYEDHSEAMRLLEPLNFVCFKRSLEMDLVASSGTRAKLSVAIGLNPNASELKLLVDYKKAIKKQPALLATVDQIDARKLPAALRLVRRILSDVVA